MGYRALPKNFLWGYLSHAPRQQIDRIKSALDRARTTNAKVTSVRSGANGIQEEAEALRQDVTGALLALKTALYLSPGQRSLSPAAEQQAEADGLDAGPSA